MNALWSVDDFSSDEEEDGGSNKDKYDTGRRVFTFVIDVDETMFDNNGKFMIMSLMAIRNILMKCVRESKTDIVGVVLFNTKDVNSNTNFEHITNYIPVGDLNAEKILKLEKLIEQGQLDDLKKFSCDPTLAASLANKSIIKNTLWHCQSLRDKVNMKVCHHCIVLFTPQDSPKEDYKLVLQQANDMGTNKKSSLTVIGLGEFQYGPFYKDVLVRANNMRNEDWTEPGPFNRVEAIVDNMNVYRNPVRCFRRLKLSLGDGVELAMSAYNITKGKTSLFPSSSLVSSEDNERVESSTMLQTRGTGEILLKNEVSYYTKVQGTFLVPCYKLEALIRPEK
uniref:X-ray repair cross-complementing protein 6 n=1 Tax=Cacopsylla melanoneura TaxID=428564 RepID=A0A8D9BWG6_9HEMI